MAIVAIVTSFVKHSIGDEVFPRTVRFDYSPNQVLRNLFVVYKKLLGVFWKAVAAIAEGL